MPYRHAHRWLLVLVPLIGIAFWPGYLGQLRSAPFALHAHGLTAAAWLALVGVQSWSIQARHAAWHRAAGRVVFVVLPLFAAAGPLALQGMARLWRSGADPFHAAFGARLVIADMIAGPTVILLAAAAIARRRDVAVHAAAMLATVLMVLPPVIGRVFPAIPGFPSGGWAGFGGFRLALQLAEGLTLILATWLAWRHPRGRVAFGLAAGATLAQMVGFETVGATRAWERWVVALTDLPSIPLALAAGAGAAGILWWAWRRGAPQAERRGARRPRMGGAEADPA